MGDGADQSLLRKAGGFVGSALTVVDISSKGLADRARSQGITQKDLLRSLCGWVGGFGPLSEVEI